MDGVRETLADHLRKIVAEAYQNAVENGYGEAIESMTDAELADDMIDLDGELNDLWDADVVSINDVTWAVGQVRLERMAKR